MEKEENRNKYHLTPGMGNRLETVCSTAYALGWIEGTRKCSICTTGDLFPLVAHLGFSP